MNWNRTLLSAALLLSLVAAPRAFGQTTVETAVGPASTGTTVIAPLSNRDMHFMLDAAAGNNAEIMAGQLAVQRGTTDAVKAYGQQMVTEHSAVGADMMRLAVRKGIALPTQTDDLHKESVFQLGNLSGKAFDDAYINSQIADHKRMIALFQSEARNGRDPDLRAMATKLLPSLQSHLAMAQQLRDSKGASMQTTH